MSNSLVANPSILAEGVVAAIKGKLPSLAAFSKVFTAAQSAPGKTVQVPLVGTSTAVEFGSDGYLTTSNATLTKTDVTLKHFIVPNRFTPLNVKEYGAQFLYDSFVPGSANALVEKCMAEISALILNANYSSEVNTGASLSYAEVVTSKGVLDAAKAGDPRALILNSTYANGLLSDTTIVGNSVIGAGIVTSGQIGTLAGAAVYQWTTLPTNSENLAGFHCGADAIAVASALPMTEIAGASVGSYTDPESGLSVQVVAFQEQSGLLNVTAEMLFGAGVGRATSLQRLITAARS